MSSRHEVALLDVESGEYVSATLIERVDVDYARAVDDVWVTYLAAEAARAEAAGRAAPVIEHGHWRWEKKVAYYQRLLPNPTLAVECDGTTQGMMLLETARAFGCYPEHRGSPLVGVLFLATAPWNHRTVAEQPRYKGVGKVLMNAAVQTSFELGFKGRVGLEALSQAEGFYESIGMVCCGPGDPEHGNLNVYEMTAEKASAFLRGGDGH